MTVEEIGDVEDSDSSVAVKLTDEERGVTHGYEGSFKVGDIVKVIKHMKIYSVKQYSKDGFDPYGFIGRVAGLDLYGRKYKTLCSAITPIRVEFLPDEKSLPANMFDKKWSAHFESSEVELVINSEST